jgi:hypothetical protein
LELPDVKGMYSTVAHNASRRKIDAVSVFKIPPFEGGGPASFSEQAGWF